ncbi:MAG TPA: hypothetical protein DCM05_08480 [Elusimicrobia bacterium]|nr:hypothetical protein [Elusimicrobiota bacterium]
MALQLFFLLLPAFSFAQAPSRALGLPEAYSLALARSEELAQKAESAAEAWARVDELWSAVKPQITLNGTYFYQDDSKLASNRRDKPQAGISAAQTVFTGLRDILAVRVGQAQGRSSDLDLQRAKDALYLDVAAAYLDLFDLQSELAIRRNLVGITLDRIKELKDRQKIGRTRKSEVMAAEAQLAGYEADLTMAQRRELDSQEKLRFLTGLAEALAPQPLTLAPAGPLEGFLDAARRRADVEARRRDSEAAGLSVDIARRARWPVVSFGGNYWLKRLAPLDDVDWDVSLTGSLPLYEGGRISAQTRQAEQRRRKAEQALSLALRKAELEVRTAFDDLGAGQAAVAALEKAVAAAEANARSQAEDYRLGVVTNLDVLGALNSFQQARLRLEQARDDVLLSRIRLDVAAGEAKR